METNSSLESEDSNQEMHFLSNLVKKKESQGFDVNEIPEEDQEPKIG